MLSTLCIIRQHCVREGECARPFFFFFFFLALLPTWRCWAWRRFRQILKKIVETKQEMGRTMRAGAFALTEAKYAAGEFATTVLDSVESVRVQTTLDPCTFYMWLAELAQLGQLAL